MDLAALRAQTEDLTTELTRARAETASGRRASLDLSAFRAHPDVAGLDAVQLAREAQVTAATKGETRRALRLGALAEHLFGLAADRAARTALADQQEIEASTKITGIEPGETLALQAAIARLPSVENRDARAGLEARIVHVSRAFAGATARAFEATQGLAQKAGFAHTVDAVETLAGLDLRALAADCRTYLQDTEAMYGDVLGWWLKRVTNQKPFPHGAERHDLLHALTLAPYAGLLPRGDITKVLTAALAPMGLDPLADKRIRYDGEERATKRARAAAFGLQVPDEVVVSWRPQGALADATGFLHAFGVAQHLANTDPQRPFEDRAMGDASVPEAIGFLFEHWLLDRGWLKRHLEAQVPDFTRLLALAALFRTRERAARLVYETELQVEGISAGQPERYAELLSTTLLARWPEGLSLAEVSPRLQLAREVRGFALEAQLHGKLRDRFDEDWWANPRSGAYLGKIFEQGLHEPAQVVAEKLALGPLTLKAAAKRFEALLA